MPKQTAVAWLIQELVWEQKIDLDTKMLDLLDKVVAMEGQQIVDAFNQGQQHPYNDWSAEQGIQYYNETYASSPKTSDNLKRNNYDTRRTNR